MDYGRTPTEVELLARLHGVADRAAGHHDLLRLASDGQIQKDLDAAIADSVALGATLLERLLIVEDAARLGLPALPGLRLLVGCEVLDPASTTAVAVIDRQRPGPARLPPGTRRAIVLDGPRGSVIDLSGRRVTPVRSSFGYPYAEVEIDGGSELPPPVAALARRRWHLTMAAEIAGTASGALDHLSGYLNERKQFGQRLATFQALRHRVAELAVTTEAALWLTRQAAWHGDAPHAGVAVSYARDLAAVMVPEIIQLSGARGFTKDVPAHLFATRLEGLRLEVGSADRLARSLSLERAAPVILQ